MIGSVRAPGKFYNRHREVGFSDGTFVGLELSMDVQVIDEALADATGFDRNDLALATLAEGDLVMVRAVDPDAGTERELGTYQFLRRLPKQADESGLMVLELAYPL